MFLLSTGRLRSPICSQLVRRDQLSPLQSFSRFLSLSVLYHRLIADFALHWCVYTGLCQHHSVVTLKGGWFHHDGSTKPLSVKAALSMIWGSIGRGYSFIGNAPPVRTPSQFSGYPSVCYPSVCFSRGEPDGQGCLGCIGPTACSPASLAS